MSQIPLYRFRITCHGRSELPEDDPIYGTWWARSFIHLGGADQLTDAMLLAERYASERESCQPEGVLRFSPHRVLIQDPRMWLVVGGRFEDERIGWLAPVASVDETARVRTEIRRLRGEASFERGWDNYSTADSLDSHADLLELHLVDPTWRAPAALAVLSAKYRAGFRQAGLPHEVSKARPVIEAWGLSYVTI